MVQEWYLWLDNKKTGPYSKSELRAHPDFTPDTLVWKQGFEDWVLARYVEELADLFEDPSDETEESTSTSSLDSSDTEIILEMQGGPPYFLIWLLIVLLLFIIATEFLR